MSDPAVPSPGADALPEPAGKWPKTFPALTAEQRAISDDFMKHWHEVLPNRFGRIEKFNHRYCLGDLRDFGRTLEIGAGLGEHLAHEPLSDEQRRNYYALELRENMAAAIRERFPDVHAIVGDCQRRLDSPDGFFDRILAVHVLEHLPDLPSAVRELRRLCDPHHGYLSIVIPCEGGFAYSLARKISAQRIFEKRYHQPYKWFIEREHVNRPGEIIEELSRYFRVIRRKYWPLRIPAEWCNLVIGLTLVPKED